MKTALFLVCLGGLVGCASPTEETEGDLTSDLTKAASSSTATLKSVPVKEALQGCTFEGTLLETTLKTGKVTFGNVNFLLESCFIAGSKATTRSFKGSPKVLHNGNGLLSVNESFLPLSELGADHVHAQLFFKAYDLASGKQLGINDVLDAEGRAIAEASCHALLKADKVTSGANWMCGFEAEAEWSLDAKGIRVYPRILHENQWKTIIKGGFTPWSALEGHITNAAAKALAD